MLDPGDNNLINRHSVSGQLLVRDVLWPISYIPSSRFFLSSFGLAAQALLEHFRKASNMPDEFKTPDPKAVFNSYIVQDGGKDEMVNVTEFATMLRSFLFCLLFIPSFSPSVFVRFFCNAAWFFF